MPWCRVVLFTVHWYDCGSAFTHWCLCAERWTPQTVITVISELSEWGSALPSYKGIQVNTKRLVIDAITVLTAGWRHIAKTIMPTCTDRVSEISDYVTFVYLESTPLRSCGIFEVFWETAAQGWHILNLPSNNAMHTHTLHRHSDTYMYTHTHTHSNTHTHKAYVQPDNLLCEDSLDDLPLITLPF